MLRTFSRFTLILPTFFLIAAVGLFLAVEVRMFLHDNLMQEIVNDPVPDQAMQLQSSVWDVRRALGNYGCLGPSPAYFNELTAKYKALQQAFVDFEGYFLAHAEEAEEHTADSVFLHAAEDDLLKLQDIFPKAEPFDADTMRAVYQNLESITLNTYAFAQKVKGTHQMMVNHLFAMVDREEQYRNVLSGLILVCGLALIILLMRMAASFRRNAEVAWAMERYNALFGAALHSLHVGVLIRDMQKLERPVVFINKAFTDHTGYDFSSMKDKKSDVLFGWHTNPAAIESFHDAVRSEKAVTFNILIYRKDGSSFWSEWHISPVRDKAGKLTHFVSLITDVTALKQAQEGLLLAKEQAERASAVKTNFLATMSHEIRTPINGLLGVLDLLNDTSLSDDQRKYIDIAMTSGKALHVIINDILDYAKMEAGKVDLVVEPFALRSLLQDAIDISTAIAQRKNIALTLDVQDSAPDELVSDLGRIRQIILNLLSNAIKFTDKGGVTLRVLHLLTQETGEEAVALLRFEVEDTGIGISAVDQDKLFKEFSQVERSFTRRFGGTGLGLAITRRLVEMMNGEIGVNSKPGQGSTFWFMLPLPVMKGDFLLPRSDGRMQSLKVLGDAPKSNKAILLVEDNETNRLVTTRYLEKAGFTPDIAVNGVEAVQLATQKPYDLILMDISMAEMDGLQATQHIREDSPFGAQVPIIALTAHVMPGDRERFMSSGMNDYLNKPLDYPSLVQVLVRWLKIAENKAPAVVVDTAPVQEPAVPAAPSSPAVVADSALGVFQSDALNLDPEVLRHLAEDLGMEVVWRVTGVFLDDSQKRIKPLLENPEAESLTVLRDVAHTLKSASASCGMLRFSALMAAMEEAAAKGEADKFNALLPDVAACYQMGRAALEEGRMPYKPA